MYEYQYCSVSTIKTYIVFCSFPFYNMSVTHLPSYTYTYTYIYTYVCPMSIYSKVVVCRLSISICCIRLLHTSIYSYMSICLYLPYLSTSVYIFLAVHIPVYNVPLTLCLSIGLYVSGYLSVCLSTYLYVFLSVHIL